MKQVIIDTGGAADEAVAILMALREPTVKVHAITTGHGKAGVEQANHNALLAVYCAQSYTAPVYQGIAKPLLGGITDTGWVTSVERTEGADYRAPTQQMEKEHAVDAMVRLVGENPGEIDLLCLGPLTNIAYAMLQFPQVVKKVAHITMLGGAHFYNNAFTACAEFNILADPEAASIVFGFGVPLTLVIRDVGKNGSAALNAQEMEQLRVLGEVGSLFMHSDAQLELPAAAAFAVLVKPQLVKSSFTSETIIDLGGKFTRGTTIFRRQRAYFESAPVQFNSTVVTEVVGQDFKRYVFGLMREE